MSFFDGGPMMRIVQFTFLAVPSCALPTPRVRGLGPQRPVAGSLTEPTKYPACTMRRLRAMRLRPPSLISSLAAALATLLLASGCAQNAKVVAPEIVNEQFKFLRDGKTTQREILARLGDPRAPLRAGSCRRLPRVRGLLRPPQRGSRKRGREWSSIPSGYSVHQRVRDGAPQPDPPTVSYAHAGE